MSVLAYYAQYRDRMDVLRFRFGFRFDGHKLEVRVGMTCTSHVRVAGTNGGSNGAVAAVSTAGFRRHEPIFHLSGCTRSSITSVVCRLWFVVPAGILMGLNFVF